MFRESTMVYNTIMNDILRFVLVAVLVVAAVNFIVYAARNERVKVIDIEKDFTVRYPRVYLFICIVFFLLVSVLLLNMLVWRSIGALALVLTIVLAALGVPFLLLSVVWKIKVRPEYIIYVSAIGAKKQIYYKDISKALLTRSTLILFTTLRIYRLSPNLMYCEYFLKRLNINGVEIERR